MRSHRLVDSLFFFMEVPLPLSYVRHQFKKHSDWAQTPILGPGCTASVSSKWTAENILGIFSEPNFYACCFFPNRRARRRLHLVEGFLAVLLDVDRAVQVVRSAADTADASTQLQDAFGLSTEQARGVLSLTLGRLTRLEVTPLPTASYMHVSISYESNVFYKKWGVCVLRELEHRKCWNEKKNSMERTNELGLLMVFRLDIP
jgi:hypothetical protein